MTCPVCHGSEVGVSVRRDRLPVMQNYVHRTRASALMAPAAPFALSDCRTCGYAWNSVFDPTLLAYDAGYDNTVASRVIQAYYAEVADHLRSRYDLDGLIVDIGCGNGEFLRTLCNVAGTRGLGIDPALATSAEADGQIRFVGEAFSADLIVERPALVVCRHVLEHIPDPVAFLRTVRDALQWPAGVPCFFEVPDLTWILDRCAFWDFCYEHCNYFTHASVAVAARRGGFDTTDVRNAFGGQYLWVDAATADGPTSSLDEGEGSIEERLARYAGGEHAQIAAAREWLRHAKRQGTTVVVWGMATKGVLFSLLVDPDASLVDACVDANANKQGCFVPLTARSIEAPRALVSRLGDQPLTVIAMNDNYRSEIEQTCTSLGLDATVVASGDVLGRYAER